MLIDAIDTFFGGIQKITRLLVEIAHSFKDLKVSQSIDWQYFTNKKRLYTSINFSNSNGKHGHAVKNMDHCPKND